MVRQAQIIYFRLLKLINNLLIFDNNPGEFFASSFKKKHILFHCLSSALTDCRHADWHYVSNAGMIVYHTLTHQFVRTHTQPRRWKGRRWRSGREPDWLTGWEDKQESGVKITSNQCVFTLTCVRWCVCGGLDVRAWVGSRVQHPLGACWCFGQWKKACLLLLLLYLLLRLSPPLSLSLPPIPYKYPRGWRAAPWPLPSGANRVLWDKQPTATSQPPCLLLFQLEVYLELWEFTLYLIVSYRLLNDALCASSCPTFEELMGIHHTFRKEKK